MKNKKKLKREARKEVLDMFNLAVDVFKEAPAKAHDLVRKARRAAMKVQLRMPRVLQRRICKHCYHLLVPGENCRVRIQKSRVIIYCKDCKNYTRIPISSS